MGTKQKTTKASLGTMNKYAVPFYEPPSRKTSAEIINEARLAIKGREPQVTDNSYATNLIKPLQTQRPFTPRDKERIFFGQRAKVNRPPSSFSLRYLQSEGEINIPLSTPEDVVETHKNRETFNSSERNHIRRPPDPNEQKIFNLEVKEIGVQKIRLPSLDTIKNMQKKKLCKSTFSLDNLPEEGSINYGRKPVEGRNAFSSPQERTDCNENLRNKSPFGRPSKQLNLSQCLLLGPQNLNNVFDNKQIVENSGTLFTRTGYFNKLLNKRKNSEPTMYSLDEADVKKVKTADDVIELLMTETGGHNDTAVIKLLDELYTCLERENLLNAKMTSKTKIHILKCLYKFVESQNETLLLNIARIILSLKVTGNNLNGVCKLLFKVSKNDKNDHLFLQNNILELFVDTIGRSSPLDDAEACVYGYGSIKFLTMNQKLLKIILSLGILPLMVLHLKIINNAKTEKLIIPEHTNHALFQLTGTLRNLANEETMCETFIKSKTVLELSQTMDLFSSDLDIISNISRTLSTISTNDECCDEIPEYPKIYQTFIRLFEKCPENEEIIVRLAYILGNILSRSDVARVEYYHQTNSIDCLMNVWQIYLEKTLKYCSLQVDDERDECNNAEDVMIKIIRIVAHMAINSEIGKLMNDKHGMLLINGLLKVLISNPFNKNEELILSILSTLNNLSFYYSSELDQDIFHIKQIDIMEGISEYITAKNEDCVTEAMRIIGNLSRSKITRKYICEKKMFNQFLHFLDKDNIPLMKTTIGVLVNLMADGNSRFLLKQADGVSKMVNVLHQYGQNDWSLAMLICQVIWNYCIDNTNLYDLLSDGEIEQMMAILIDYLDEEKLFGVSDSMENLEILSSQEYLVWEEFANVATNLLEKIEQFLDMSDSLKVNNGLKLSVPRMQDSSTNLSFASW